jgi:hypothetical protein
VRRKPGTKPTEYILPQPNKKSFGNTKDYKYFWGHAIQEVTVQMPSKPVVCWHNDHVLSLPLCAFNKFVKEKTYCKRCPLFQGDEHSQTLRELIEKWERDEVIENAS